MTRYRGRRQAQPAPVPYSITRQVVRDVVLTAFAFSCLIAALVLWLAGAR